MVELADLLAKALASPARPRFHATTMGLSFIQSAGGSVAGLEKQSRVGELGVADVRWRGKEALLLLRHAPPGRDGTGKDVAETRQNVRRWLRRIGEAARKNRGCARPILEDEVGRILASLEAELRDPEMLRWTIETPEEWDQVRSSYLVAREGILFLRQLGADVGEAQRRLMAFRTAIRPFLSRGTEPQR